MGLKKTDTRGLEPVRYGGVLLSAPLTLFLDLHHLLNVHVQLANKIGLKKQTHEALNLLDMEECY
jgi:hypothetical protein